MMKNSAKAPHPTSASGGVSATENATLREVAAAGEDRRGTSIQASSTVPQLSTVQGTRDSWSSGRWGGKDKGSGNRSRVSSTNTRPKARDRKKLFAKSSAHLKPNPKRVFNTTIYRQRLKAHTGPIWTLKFNKSGLYLATGGDEHVVKIWKVAKHIQSYARDVLDSEETMDEIATLPYLEVEPVRIFKGHQKEVVDLDWSHENFLLSASMDQSVRLWHISKPECLRVFMHLDIVSTVAFHPLDNTTFLSATFNGTLRLWSFVKNSSVSTAQLEAFITCSAMNADGSLAYIGTMDGHVHLYSLRNEITGDWKLNNVTQIDIYPEKNTPTKATGGEDKGGGSRRRSKVAGITISPSGKECLITANDSHVRLHMLNDKSMRRIYRGHPNEYSNLKGTFSDDERFVLCASDSRTINIWERQEQPSAVAKSRNRVEVITAFESIAIEDEKGNKKDRLTAAIFAPRADPEIEPYDNGQTNGGGGGHGADPYIILVAAVNGMLTILQTTDIRHDNHG